MNVMEAILRRRSVRSYAKEEIPEEKLRTVVQAGLLAPTSRDLKPCEFYVVRDRETLDKLAGAKNAGAGMLKRCGAAVAVFGDAEKADTWAEDCSIAMSFMMLAAQEQEIGNCWVQIRFRSDADGNSAEENVRRILNVPEKFRIAGILSLGIPEGEAAPHAPQDADWGKVHTV